MLCGGGWTNGKKTIWQHRGKAIWAAESWQDMAAQVEKLTVKVHHVDVMFFSSVTLGCVWKNGEVDQATKIKVSQVDLDW